MDAVNLGRDPALTSLSTSAPGVLDGHPQDEINWDQVYYTTVMDLDAQISLAETKAHLIMGASAILLAAIGLDRGSAHRYLLNGQASWLEHLSFILLLLTFCSLLVSIFYALVTARPNLRHPRQACNPLFFSHAALMTEQEYLDNFLNISKPNLTECMIAQLYSKSRVTQQKFYNTQRSLDFLFLTFVLWMISRLLLAFAA